MRNLFRVSALSTLLTLAAAFGLAACGDADDLGVAAVCSTNDDCNEVDGKQLTCLTGFKGGYCGISGCTKNADCPSESICVTKGGTNYCFRTCNDKTECNENRTTDNEANCSSSITRVEAGNLKACVPPSA